MAKKQEPKVESLEERQRANLEAGRYEAAGIDAEELERLQGLRRRAEAQEAKREKHFQEREAEKRARLDALRQAEAEKKAQAAEVQAKRQAEARRQAQEKAEKRAAKAAEVGRLRRRFLDLRTERRQAETAVHDAQVALGRVRGLSDDAEALDGARAEVERCERELAEIEAAIDAVAAELAAANPGETVKGHRVVRMAGVDR